MRRIRQLLTANECYLVGRPMVPRGVMVHSTAANNPRLSRYVAPDDGLLGAPSANHWNQFRPGGRQVCVHAFIGKLADGTVAACQTLPWDMEGWHAGGSANHTHIGFEICEDGLDDPAYFALVYREAAELTAYLCREYGLDPLADGVVLCHAEGFKRGVASNHGDVLHWFPRFGKDMDDFRRDVAAIMEKEEREMDYQEFQSHMDRWLKEREGLPASDWAEDFVAKAKAAGFTDGSRPRAFATREEVVTMVAAAGKSTSK